MPNTQLVLRQQTTFVQTPGTKMAPLSQQVSCGTVIPGGGAGVGPLLGQAQPSGAPRRTLHLP